MNSPLNRYDRIRASLETAFAPSYLDLSDDSARHAGHLAARENGGGHFSLTIVSSHFSGHSSLSRHRLIYAALKDEIGPAIHALSISAYAPEEWEGS